MQNAKDSFYIALRTRLAAVNPGRVITVRAVQRPSVLVEEAEAPVMELPNDVFVLRWTTAVCVENVPGPLYGMGCEIHYATSGSQANAGLDRGRSLTEMDSELLQMLQPMCTPKLAYTTTPATALETNVFWTEAVLEPVETVRDQLSRVVKTTMYSFEERSDE